MQPVLPQIGHLTREGPRRGCVAARGERAAERADAPHRRSHALRRRTSRSLARLAAFQESGWAVGRNLRIDYRWIVGDRQRGLSYLCSTYHFALHCIVEGNPSLFQLWSECGAKLLFQAPYQGVAKRGKMRSLYPKLRVDGAIPS